MSLKFKISWNKYEKIHKKQQWERIFFSYELFSWLPKSEDFICDNK